MNYIRALKQRMTFLQSALLTHCKVGALDRAFGLLSVLIEEGFRPDKVVLLRLLRSLTGTRHGQHCRVLHDQIIRFGLESELSFGNTLINTYIKWGCLKEALKIFNRLKCPDVISWGSIMFGHTQYGHGRHALNLYFQMQQQGISPDKFIFICMLKACGKTGDLSIGTLIQNDLIQSNFPLDAQIGNALMNMYIKCGDIEQAHKLFNEFSFKTLVPWGALIEGYTLQDNGHQALVLFKEMQDKGIQPNSIIFLFVLKACGSIGCLVPGKILHCQVIKHEFESDVAICSTLVEMYSRCGSLYEAQKVFDSVSNKDPATWGALIGGYVQCGRSICALHIFEKLQQEGITPTKATFASILKGCGTVQALIEGMHLHHDIIKSGFQTDLIIASALVDMYTKCGSLDEACRVFDSLPNRDTVSWGAIIAGFVMHGLNYHAFDMFRKMLHERMKPSKEILLSILKACSQERATCMAMIIHELLIECTLETDLIVGNALIDAYAKCGNINEAFKIFNQLTNHDFLSWDLMLAAFTSHGHAQCALDFFVHMQLAGQEPSNSTFVSILKVCNIEQCRIIHYQIYDRGIELEVGIGNALVEVYVKSGYMEEAHKVCDDLVVKDPASWGLLIVGYAQQNNCSMTRQCLKSMQEQGLKPNGTFLTNVLVACNQTGLLEEGCKIFSLMLRESTSVLKVEHYGCLMDLLGRAGLLSEVKDLLETMPIISNVIMWRSLLSNCENHGNIQLGRRCFKHVAELDPIHVPGYADLYLTELPFLRYKYAQEMHIRGKRVIDL